MQTSRTLKFLTSFFCHKAVYRAFTQDTDMVERIMLSAFFK
jgi:hypothetical protein